MVAASFRIWDIIAAIAFVGLGGIFVWKYSKKPRLVRTSSFYAKAEYNKRPQPALFVSVKGGLPPGQDHARYRVSIYDRTGGGTHPIRSSIDAESFATGFVTVESPEIQIPTGPSAVWMKIFTIPMDLLEFGYGGTRKLLFVIEMIDEDVSAQSALEVTVTGDGFLKSEQRLPDIYTSIFYLASGLRTLSAQIDKIIVEKTANCLAEQSENWDEEAKQLITDKFTEILVETNQHCSWDEACSDYASAIRRYANDSIKQKILMLFYQLIDHDPAIDDEQSLKILFALTKSIRADMGMFCQLADKNFADAYIKQDVDVLLGIHDEMTTSEIELRIRHEYKRWNDRVIHSNPEMRERAKHILDLIARRRSELTGK